jgi:hypothetical protein
VGACEFVMRLLARVTGERSEAVYVWILAGAVPEKRKDRNTRFPGSYSEVKQKFSGTRNKKKEIHATIPKKLGSGRELPPGMFVDSWFPTKQR